MTKKIAISLELELEAGRPMTDEMVIWAVANIYLRPDQAIEKQLPEYGLVKITRTARTARVYD